MSPSFADLLPAFFHERAGRRGSTEGKTRVTPRAVEVCLGMEQEHIPEQTPVTLGTRHAPSWAERYPFSLSMEDRRRHLFVLGQTGVGKSTLLKSIIKQDILAGRGVGYIDPHGQDAEDILRSIPSWRADDVVYFNAADFAHPMAWNLLAQDRIDPTDRDRVASIIVSGFQGIFGNSWGPLKKHQSTD